MGDLKQEYKIYETLIQSLQRLVIYYPKIDKNWKSNEEQEKPFVKEDLTKFMEWVEAISAILSLNDLAIECFKIAGKEKDLPENVKEFLDAVSSAISTVIVRLQRIDVCPSHEVMDGLTYIPKSISNTKAFKYKGEA